MSKQYLTFNIEQQVYGFPIERVREINRIGQVTRIPNTEIHYSGVMNVRGSIISVVSLRSKMGLNEQDNTASTCTIIVDCGAQKLAVVVDAVQSVINIEDFQIEKSKVAQSGVSYIEEVAKLENGIVMLVDIEKCFLLSEEQAA